MTKKLINAPVAEPVTLAEAKLHCRVDSSDEDALIGSLIKTARQMAEEKLNRVLITQTWDLIIDAFPEYEIKLPFPDVQSVTSVKYVSGGSELTLSGSLYTLDSYDGYECWLFNAPNTSWPDTDDSANAVKVRFVAGYGADGSFVPEPIKQWMLLQISHFYANRMASSEKSYSLLPFVDCLIDPYKVWQ